MFSKETEYPLSQTVVQDMTEYGDGYYQLTGDNGTGYLYIARLDGITDKLINIRLDIELPQAYDDPYRESGIINMKPLIRDEGHDEYFELEERVYRPDTEDSHYMWIQSAGKVKTLAIRLALSEGNIIQIKGISLNAKRAFSISPVRLMLIYLTMLAVFVLRPGSWIWKKEDAIPGIKRIALAAAAGAVLILPAVALDAVNGSIWTENAFRPYQMLAESFAAGHLYIMEAPPAEFEQMENPYDHGERESMGLQMDVDYLWDTAYYNGKYYCYFGVVPCILFYLPVYLISGIHLHDAVLTLLLAACIYAGIYLLVREWVLRYRASTPYAYIPLISIMVFLGSGLPVVLSDPDAHDVPRVAGLAFVIWGLYLWMSAMKREEKGLKINRLAVGSLFMALAVGCRPNQALWSFMAVPFFVQYLRCEGEEYDRKKRAGAIAAFVIPYIPVAAALMTYNMLRFGSVADFGYSYNLTVLDYTRSNFSADRLFIGLFEYLFRMPALTYHFPYIPDQGFLQFNELGHGNFYYTVNYAGMLTTNLLLWCFAGLACSKNKDKAAILMLVIALVELVINSCVAGVAYHYRLDFAAFMLLAAAAGAAGLGDMLKESRGVKWLKCFLVTALILSVLYHGCFYIASSLKNGNTQLYYDILNSCI